MKLSGCFSLCIQIINSPNKNGALKFFVKGFALVSRDSSLEFLFAGNTHDILRSGKFLLGLKSLYNDFLPQPHTTIAVQVVRHYTSAKETIPLA